MKNGLYKLAFPILLSVALASCSSDDDNGTENLDGKYSGTFTVNYFNGDTSSNPVTVRFYGENNYQCSGNSQDYVPAGGSGHYEIRDSTIVFSDTNFWTANFDSNLILSGEYNYSIDGNELVISANKNDVGQYTYELVKEK